MKDPKIKSSLHTHWPGQWDVVKQPDGVDYSQLSKLLEKEAAKESKKASSNVDSVKPMRRDLRKQSYTIGDQNGTQQDTVIDTLDKKSIIPIPGMLIEYENGESDRRPPDSDWIAPHGIPYNPMTF